MDHRNGEFLSLSTPHQIQLTISRHRFGWRFGAKHVVSHYQNQWWPWGQGWGLLSQFSPFRYFPNFSELWNHTLAIEYHVYIWQVSPQLSCGGVCQIWMWLKAFNMYFGKFEYFVYGEINERSFSNPTPVLPIFPSQGKFQGYLDLVWLCCWQLHRCITLHMPWQKSYHDVVKIR